MLNTSKTLAALNALLIFAVFAAGDWLQYTDHHSGLNLTIAISSFLFPLNIMFLRSGIAKGEDNKKALWILIALLPFYNIYYAFALMSLMLLNAQCAKILANKPKMLEAISYSGITYYIPYAIAWHLTAPCTLEHAVSVMVVPPMIRLVMSYGLYIPVVSLTKRMRLA